MIVPDGLSVLVDADIDGPGHLELFGDERGGIDIGDQVRHDAGIGTPELSIDADVSVGEIEVYRGGPAMSTDETRPGGRHQINIGHLVMGIAFLGIVGVWALIQTDTVTGDDIRWLLPIPWVLAGVVGLVATAITGSRRYAVRQTGWVGERPASRRPSPSQGPNRRSSPRPHP